jgi:hypothetical protein
MSESPAPELRFRFVCAPSALTGAPAGWARDLLREGEVALLGAEGLEAVDAIAHDLGQSVISVVRTEITGEQEDQTIMAYAGMLPLVWVAGEFSERARAWAHNRGPMTLLATSDGPLDDEQRRRIDRFVAILGRQSE